MKSEKEGMGSVWGYLLRIKDLLYRNLVAHGLSRES